MADGPNYEALFQGMKCLHGGNAEDVKVIVRYLRFYEGQDGYERYAKHYLPMLPKEIAAQFSPQEIKGKAVVEVTESAEEPVTISFTSKVPTPKKRGRPSSK